MLNCKQVSQLVSESIDKKLPLMTRMNLWMHLSMCGLCKGFRKTILRVHSEAKAYAADIENDKADSDVQLTADARNRIQQRLDRESL